MVVLYPPPLSERAEKRKWCRSVEKTMFRALLYILHLVPLLYCTHLYNIGRVATQILTGK